MQTQASKTRPAAVLILIFLLGTGLIMPTPAVASQGWATVGKILTGFTAANILMGTSCSRAPLARSEIIHYGYPVSSVTVHRQVEVYHPTVQVTHVRTAGPPVHTRHYYHHVPPRTRHYYHHVPPRGRPIIHYHGHHRRVVQPRIRGHIAEMQVYRGGSWVTITTHPSIW